MKINIKEIKRIKLKEGEILFVEIPEDTPQTERATLLEFLNEHYWASGYLLSSLPIKITAIKSRRILGKVKK